MTNDQAIKILAGAIKKPNPIDGYLGQALTMAINALKNQPELVNNSSKLDNENVELISREEVLKLPQRKGYAVNGWETYIRVSDIKELPSVQSRKGKWIPVDSYSAFGGDEATWMAHGNPVAFYYCSECKEQTYAGEDGEPLITEYCPNCGADMREGDAE